MKTNRIVFALLVIAILSTVLTACGTGVSGVAITTSQKARVSACDPSTLQQILNDANADAATWNKGVNAWLDEHAKTYTCITAK